MTGRGCCRTTGPDRGLVPVTRVVVKVIGWTVVLVGPPAALVWWVGWPLPTRWPDQQQVQFWLEQPASWDLVAVAGWLLWAAVIYVAGVRPRRWGRQIAAAAPSMAGTLLLLVGLPVGLLWWAGWPLSGWPSTVQVQAWLAEPLTWPTIVALTAVVGWLFWLVLLYAVIVEVAARLRRFVRWLPRIPVPTPLQGLVGGMLGAAAVSTANASTSVVPPAADLAVVSTVDWLPAHTPGSASASTTDDDGGDDVVAVGSVDGVAVPAGGWLPRPVADAVVSAGAAVWWRRRRDYQPGPIRPDRQDDDLAPLPLTVRSVQAALAYVQDPLPGLDAATAPTTGSPAGVPDPPLGMGWRASTWPGDLPGSAVTLVGAGAADAARGILATALLMYPPRPVRPAVVITAADLHTLLGAAAPDHRQLPGLEVTGQVEDVVARLEQILLEANAPGRGLRQRSAPDRLGDQTVAVLAAPPTDPDLSRRLALLTTLGHQHGLTAAVLGEWPAAVRLHIDVDGTTQLPDRPGEQARFCVLSKAAAGDLLDLVGLRSAHEPTTPPAAVRADGGDRAGTDPAGSGMQAAERLVRIDLLGTTAVSCRGRPVAINRTAGVQILAFLALHPAGATSRQVATSVWPNVRPHASSDRFHTTIHALRATLREATGGHEVLIRDAELYRLDPGYIDTDVAQLTAAVQAAAAATGPHDRQAAARAVIDTYHGDLAAGHDWPWLAPHREAIRRHVLDAYTSLAAVRPHDAVTLLHQARQVDPVNAFLHRQSTVAICADSTPPRPRR